MNGRYPYALGIELHVAIIAARRTRIQTQLSEMGDLDMSKVIKVCAANNMGYHRYCALCLELGMNPMDEDQYYDAVEEYV